MAYFLIRGGIPLKGSVSISGSREAAIVMIAASLLTGEEVRLSNIPDIEDIRFTLDLVRGLGVKVEELDGELRLWADDIGSTEIPRELAEKTQAAVVCLGPLLARFGKVSFPTSENCLVGDYPIDRHLKAFEALGAVISGENGLVNIRAERLVGAPIRFEKNTVLGTMNAILAGVLAVGETTVLGAALEPEVDDLIELLRGMGADIERDLSDLRKIVIRGVDKLSGIQYRILPDYNEAVVLAVAAAATRGDITLERVRPQDLTSFLSKFQAVGASYEVLGEKIRVWADPDVEFQPSTVETAPYPGFMSNWQAPFAVLLALARGESLIHETVYLRRFGYLEELTKMGVNAKILTPSEAGAVFSPQRYGFDWSAATSVSSGDFSASSVVAGEPKVVAQINGPALLRGTEVWATDFRSGAALVVAALAAEGESRILGVEHIDRGYEDLDGKLCALGAEIRRFKP